MNKICIELEIEEEKYKKFMIIVEKVGDNLNNIVNKIIEKTIEDNNVDWINESINGEVRSKNIKTKKAIQLFRERGV